MKNIRLCAILLGLVLCLSGCAPCAEDETGMVELARAQLPLSQAETLPVELVGRIDREDRSLLLIRTGGEQQRQSYFPVSYQRRGDGYRLEHLARAGMYERGEGLYSYNWQEGYVFLVDNEDCAQLWLKDELGNERTVPVDGLPFVYYVEDVFQDLDGDGRSKLEYAFLNQKGEELL